MRSNMMLSSLATALVASTGVLAHMEMIKPFPIKSKHDPKNTDGNIDYSMTRPLSDTDPSDYPCFGYHKAEAHSVESWSAGETYQLEIGGSAVHGGGSCQLSLSYDEGATFTVIKSMLGNCPIQTSYSFTIPSEAPSGKNVLFAWTWFNKVGNREMYMNCARVDIAGGSGQLSGPEIFKANVGVTECKTIEGEDVVFPNLGPEVEYGVPALKGKAPTSVSGCGTSDGGSPPVVDDPENENGGNKEDPVPTIAPVPTVAPSSSAALAPTSSPTLTSSEAAISSVPVISSEAPISSSGPDAPEVPEFSSSAVATTSAAASSSAVLTTVKTAPVAAPTNVAPGDCVNGSLQCSDDGSSWSLCNNGSWMDMGAVAPGTSCRNGGMTFKTTDALGHCEGIADGETKCGAGNKSWAVCLNGTWIDMGAVSAGTTCADGKIVALEKRATHTRLHRHRRAHGAAGILRR